MILVTGADGFIGERLCNELHKRGHSVRGALWQSAPLPDGCESIVVGDISGDADWSAVLCDVDVVIHLAARVHVMEDGADDPLAEFRKVNVVGTERLARSAAASGVKRIVFMSSVKVNGEGRQTPYTENDTPAPSSPYGITKYEAENVLRKVTTETGLQSVIIRAPLVYGPRVKANFLELADYVYKKIPLPLASVNNSRSFISLTNLCDFIAKCVVRENAANETFLVSDNRDLSTPALMNMIAKAFGRKRALLFPFPAGMLTMAGRILGLNEQVSRVIGSFSVDCAKARNMLQWMPPSSVEEELEKFVSWYTTRFV
ncbi:MAG: NAD-dependent epimerase/dehydratase family protein [Kiritimatiellae bacterium]|nr:NAD-dependent epimerase/dehydratase family protein [Kiritimatiellia bacterium]MDD5521816.1 NAD-dependent epimerase/dehydratase family protein [Kiritimatiellia bacterium]